MTEEQKQALINALTAYISQPLNNPMTRSQSMEAFRIALAALTAQPVKQPGTKCIGWVKETIHEHDEKWRDAIRAAGYEVQE